MEPVPYIDLTALNAPYLSALHDGLQKFVANNRFVLGPAVEQFEKEYANFLEAEHCVGVANATQGLELILRALEIGPGDDVLVSAYTCDATYVAIRNTGAILIPIDADLATRNLNPSFLNSALTPRTKALVAVHMAGIPCDMDAIVAFCYNHNLHLIEDNAQATGARYKGKPTGAFGIAAAHSFYPTKILGALGDGGAVTTRSEAIRHRISQLRAYGRQANGEVMPGGQNARLDELQAHFLLAKLPGVPKIISSYQHLANLYLSQLRDIEGLLLPTTPDGAEPVWHLFTILTPQRSALQVYLQQKGVGTAIHYKSYLPEIFGLAGDYPVARQVSNQTLSLPIASATVEQVMQVCEAIKQFFSK